MAIGARWDDRITGKLSEFCRDAVKIHVDVDRAEFGKILVPDLAVSGDARLVIEDLIPLVEKGERAEWLEQIAAWRSSSRCTTRRRVACGRSTSWTGWTSWVAATRSWSPTWASTRCGRPSFCAPRAIVTGCRRAAPGPWASGFPAAIGAKLGWPDRSVWAIVGDGGFQMTLSELATAVVHKLAVKVIIMNNHYLGMVRQWQEMFYDNRLSASTSMAIPTSSSWPRPTGPRACICAGPLTWTA